MLKWIREQRVISRNIKQAGSLRADFAARSRLAKNWDERNQLLAEMDFEVSQYEDETAFLRSQRIIEEAQRFLLPIPAPSEESPHWDKSRVLGTWSLTNHGLTELRRSIRLERRERREGWMAWGGLLVSILSLVTAILALMKGV